MAAFDVRVDRREPGSAFDLELDGRLKSGLIAAMPGLRMAELFACRPTIFSESEFLVTTSVANTDDLLAVLGASWRTTANGLRFLHIGLQFVAETAQGSGVFQPSWHQLLAAVADGGEFPALSALKTYNPIAFCAMRAYGRLPGAAMFPELEGQVDAGLARIAAEVAEDLAPGRDFDPTTGVIRGIGVPANLYRERPGCDDPVVNRYFEDHLEPGDRLLSLVHVTDARTQQGIWDKFASARRQPAAR